MSVLYIDKTNTLFLYYTLERIYIMAECLDSDLSNKSLQHAEIVSEVNHFTCSVSAPMHNNIELEDGFELNNGRKLFQTAKLCLDEQFLHKSELVVGLEYRVSVSRYPQQETNHLSIGVRILNCRDVPIQR